MNAMKNTKHNVSKSNKKVSTFWLVAIIFAIIVIISNIGGGSSTQHNYNDNSTTNRLLAKNYFKDYIKDNLKNAKSYEEVSYTSSFNSSKGCYEVTLKYRATNSFGAYVLESASGDVYFIDGVASIKNVHRE